MAKADADADADADAAGDDDERVDAPDGMGCIELAEWLSEMRERDG